jgi:lipid-A-disaccharide synthase
MRRQTIISNILEKNKSIFIIAGERSGDLHGGNLVRALKEQNPNVVLKGWGGDEMQNAGMLLLKHYRDIAFMGFWEIIKNIFTIKKILEECKKSILLEKPSAVLLIDYGGFNMKIAKFCHENKVPVHYYISPKVWAWNTKRAYKIKKYVDHLYCILPFEPSFFKRFGYDTKYVGNPVVDAIRLFRAKDEAQFESQKPIVAILPGSRRQEVVQMLDLMISVVPQFPDYEFVVTAVDNLDDSLYEKARQAGLRVVYNKTYPILNVAKAALVTSGTATLETAVFGVPQAVCYKASNFNYRIAKFVIQVPFISLVNLIAEKEVVKELIQDQFNTDTVSKELHNLLENENYRQQIKSEYQNIDRLLGDQNASMNVASLVLGSLK